MNRPRGRPGCANLHRLVDDDIRLAAGQRPVRLRRGARPAASSMSPMSEKPQVAEGLVGRALGQDHHVSRLAAALRQLVHAVDEGQHHGH